VPKLPRRVNVKADHDIISVVEDVQRDGEPRLLQRSGIDIAVILSLSEYEALTNGDDSIWATYDAEKVKERLHSAAGALAGVGREQLLRDVYDARGQDSRGRPA